MPVPDRLVLSRTGVWRYLAVALPALAGLLATASTVDLAYQVRAGRLMLDTGGVLRADPFTFTVNGQPWLDQQWGAQVVLAWVFGLGGWSALVVARAALIAATFGCLSLALGAAGLSGRRAAWLALAAFVVAAPALAMRPQLLGLACFAACGWLLLGRRAQPWRAWLVVAVAAVWANVHGSFVLAPALTAVVALEDGLSLGWRSPALRRSVVLTLAVSAATLANPFLAGAWTYALSLSVDPQVRRLVTEWQPADPLSVPGALFGVSLVVAAALTARQRVALRRDRAAWPWLVWVLGLAALGVVAERGIAWWALGAPLGLAAVAGAGPAPARSAAPQTGERRALANTVLAVVVAGALVVALPTWRDDVASTGAAPSFVTDAPAEVAAALASAVRPGGRVLADERWASWLELQVPDALEFVDPRIELFPAPLWAEYLVAVGGGPGAADVLDRWHVDAVAVPGSDGLAAVLRADGRWRIVTSGTDVVAVRVR